MHRSTFHFRAIPYTPPTLVGVACILAILTATLFSACDSGGANEETDDVLVPLEEGNEWRYNSNFGEETLSLLEVTEEGNASLSTQYIYGTEAPVTISIDARSDGLVVGVADEEGAVLDGEDMLLKYPVEDGETYRYTDSGGDNTFEITVTETSVSVPAGSYEALLYEIDNVDRPTNSKIWIRPGLGVLQFYVDGDTSGRVYRLQSTNVDA